MSFAFDFSENMQGPTKKVIFFWNLQGFTIQQIDPLNPDHMMHACSVRGDGGGG
jgi:hypothetical protein